ncbi:hypothetical protein EBS80_01250 [bacterium]|nr:hypothetical protein [bacterium]
MFAVLVLFPLLPTVLVVRACVVSYSTVEPSQSDVSDETSEPSLARAFVPHESSVPSDGASVDRDDALAEIAELRLEMSAFNDETGGTFLPMLRGILDDPRRSTAIQGRSYRLPSGAGGMQMEQFGQRYRPNDPDGFYAFAMAAAIIESSPSDQALANYLEFDARRHIRAVLFVQ